ncbi:MAG TPA: BrnT family toxin [Allosphingosinicella sp.]
MEIEFDPEKREKVLRERGLDLADAAALLLGECATEVDDRFDYGEQRWISYGLLRGEVVACVWVDRGEGGVRIVTMRKASRYEQERYFRYVAGF